MPRTLTSVFYLIFRKLGYSDLSTSPFGILGTGGFAGSGSVSGSRDRDGTTRTTLLQEQHVCSQRSAHGHRPSSRPSADLPGCIAAWASSPVEIRPTLPASGRSPTVLEHMGKVVFLDCVLILTGRSIQCNPSRADFGKGQDERKCTGCHRSSALHTERNPVRRRIAFDRERNACFLVL